MESSFLSPSQSSIESFGQEEGQLSSCSSMSSDGDLPDYLDLPDYFDLPDDQLKMAGQHVQYVEKEMHMSPGAPDASFLASVGYQNDVDPSSRVSVAGVRHYESSTSLPSCLGGPGPLGMLSLRGTSRTSFEFLNTNMILPNTKCNFPLKNLAKQTREGPADEVDHLCRKHSTMINVTNPSTMPTAQQGSASAWKEGESLPAQGPKERSVASTKTYTNLPTGPADVVHRIVHNGRNSDMLMLHKNSTQSVVATTGTRVICNGTSAIPGDVFGQLPLSRTSGLLVRNQPNAQDQTCTVPRIHHGNMVMMNNCPTATNRGGPLFKIDKTTVPASSASWGGDERNWFFPKEDSPACTTQKKAFGLEFKALADPQGVSLSQLQPSNLQNDHLPIGLTRLAAQEGEEADATETSPHSTRTEMEKKSVDWERPINNRPTICTASPPQSQSPSNAHLVEEDTSTDTQQVKASIPTTQAVIKTPLEYDVLLGRGHRLNKHPGNVRFRSFVQQHQDEYLNTPVFEMKTSMTHMLVEMCKEPFTYNGLLVAPRFLRFQRDLNGWEEVSDEVVRRKVSHLLRKKMSPTKTRKFVTPT